MKQGLVYTPIKYVAVELIGDVLYWPIWWYSVGLFKIAKFCQSEIAAQESRLGLKIWIINLFTPMFGQYDIEGRIISFFARLIQIIVRSIILMIWSVVVFSYLILWIILPILTVYQIINVFIK